MFKITDTYQCVLHHENFIWISELDGTNYCNECINKMIVNNDYLTSDNWDSLYDYYINELQLDPYNG